MLISDDVAYEQNPDGSWSEAVPLPFFGIRKKCQCGEGFWRLDSYREHYRARHTDGLAYYRTPSGMVVGYRTHQVPPENHRLR